MRALGGCLAALVGLTVLGGPARSQDVEDRASRVPSITVEGLASQDVVPDIAVITLGVSTDRSSALDATSQNAKTAKALVDEIKTSGVADRDVQTTQFTLTPIYDTARSGDTQKLKGYRAANLVSVTIRKIAQAGDLAGRLIDKGANDLQGVDFLVADPQPILDALRGAATVNARHRAEIYAQAAGVKLGRILDIRPEVQQAVPYARQMKMSAAVAAAPSVPLQAGSQTFEARVTVTWALDQGQP